MPPASATEVALATSLPDVFADELEPPEPHAASTSAATAATATTMIFLRIRRPLVWSWRRERARGGHTLTPRRESDSKPQASAP